MADEKQVMENQDEITEHEVKKPLLDAFRDLFKRPAALPGEIPSKHKTTNIDMRTSMSFREFSAKMMKSVGNFFQSISKIGSSKKEENLNKIPKESISSQNLEKTSEKINVEPIRNQQQIRIPGQVSINNVRTAPTVGNISVDEAAVEYINKAKLEEGTFESDSSSDVAPIDTDLEQEVVQNAVPANTIATGTIVTGEAERDGDKKTKHTIRKKSEAKNRELEL